MRPLDFYNLGSTMAQTATTEKEYRTAIGRMYYGLHHEACCRYFRVNPHSTPLQVGKRHRQLITKFKHPTNHVANKVANLLDQLRRMRNVSDYELANYVRYGSLSFRSAQSLMNFALPVANELLDALEAYSPGVASDGCNCPTK